MKELSDDHILLGIQADATEEEIKKRYHILLKKHQSARKDGNLSAEDELNIRRTTDAYHRLLGIEIPDQKRDEGNPLKSTEKKIDNFIYYYKFHILIGIVGVALLSYFIYFMVNQSEPELSIAFLGNFNPMDQKVLEENTKTILSGINHVRVTIIPLEQGGNNTGNFGMEMKARTLLAAGEIDLWVLDRKNFDAYAPEGLFIDLAPLYPQLDIESSNHSLIVGSKKKDSKKYTFGADVSNSSWFHQSGIKGKEGIMAIREGARNFDNGVRFMKVLIESRKK